MNENITPLPWGIERTRDRLWIGPMRKDVAKVKEIVMSFDIGPAYTPEYNTRQIADAAYVLKAANAYPALIARVKELEDENAKLTRQRDVYCRDLRLLVCGMKNGALDWIDDEGRKIVHAIRATEKSMAEKAALNQEPTT